jgi:hypothetical protein
VNASVKIAATSTANFPILCNIANLLVLIEDSVPQIVFGARAIIPPSSAGDKGK